jgi:hypothetical protein
MRILGSVMILLLVSSSAVAGSQKNEARVAKEAAALEKVLTGKVSGKPVSCITLSQADRSQIIGENAIIYRVSSNRLFVNKPRGGCSGLREGRTIITRTPTSQLCSGDIARVVDLPSGFEGASCILGEFTPYTKAKG